MRTSTPKWLAGGVLAVGLCLIASASRSADDDDKKEAAAAKKAVIELAEGKGDAKTIAKKYTLDHVMRSFKLVTKGGVKIPGTEPGLEAKIQKMAKTPMAPNDLAKDSAGLIKLTEVTRAIGQIAAQTKIKPAAGKTQKDWDKFNKDMIEGAENLARAIKSGNPAMVKMAAGKLNQSCNECHGKFRDD